MPCSMDMPLTPSNAHGGAPTFGSQYGADDFDDVLRCAPRHPNPTATNPDVVSADGVSPQMIMPPPQTTVVDVVDAKETSEGFSMVSEVDPGRVIRLAQAPYDSLSEALFSRAFALHLASMVAQVLVFEVASFFIMRVSRKATDFRLATAGQAAEVPLFLALFASFQLLFDRWTMSDVRKGKLRGIRMSALNDTWWKRAFFFFADAETLMKKWPLAVLNALLLPGVPIAIYLILGCAIFGGGGMGKCTTSLWGELLFSLSWKIVETVGVVGPHFASCCNVELLWNQVDGLDIMKQKDEATKTKKCERDVELH